MQYVICHNKTGRYVKVKSGKGCWATVLKNATKFKDQEKATNFLEQNFPGMYRNIPVEEAAILSTENLTVGFKQEFVDLGNESALNLLGELKDFYNAVSVNTEKFSCLPAYFGEQIRKCDLETLDLLHKIELTNENVVAGFKRYKQLQEIRQRRRIAKDALEMSSLLLSSGLLPAMKLIKEGISEIEEWKVTRKYSPRIHEGMFDDPEDNEDEIS